MIKKEALKHSKICQKTQTFHRLLGLKVPEFEETLEKTRSKEEEKSWLVLQT